MGQQHTGRPNGERIPVGGRARPYDAPQARAVAPKMEGRGASIVIPPRFGVSWEREGPRRRSLSQASASVATLPEFTAAQRAAWSLSVWSAYSFAKSAIATSKRSLLPRYAAIDTRSPERACA